MEQGRRWGRARRPDARGDHPTGRRAADGRVGKPAKPDTFYSRGKHEGPPVSNSFFRSEHKLKPALAFSSLEISKTKQTTNNRTRQNCSEHECPNTRKERFHFFLVFASNHSSLCKTKQKKQDRENDITSKKGKGTQDYAGRHHYPICTFYPVLKVLTYTSLSSFSLLSSTSIVAIC